MTIVLALFVSAAALTESEPEHDRRNGDYFHTDTVYETRSYKSLEEWEERRAVLRRQILFAAGLDPLPERVDLRPEIFGRIEGEGFTVEKVLLRTLPGYYLGGNLYRPREGAGPFPGVLQAHGHWTHGRLEQSADVSLPTLSANLARLGYVVFVYDMVGYNDTQQTQHRFGGRLEELWGFSPLGLQLWNSIRSLDFLRTLPEVDSERIAMTGASGGGTQTFLLSAVDERVRVAAPVNMVSATMQGGDPCENAPGLRIGTYNVEIAAMMAPRPLLLVSASGDWTRNTPQMEYPMIRSVYALYDQEELVENVHVDAPHNYNRQSREAVYRFFAKHVLRQSAGKGRSTAENLSERAVPVDEPTDLLVLQGRQLPRDALTYGGLFGAWRGAARAQAREPREIAALQQRLRLAIGATWPERVKYRLRDESEERGDGDGVAVLVYRPGRGDRVPGLWFAGAGAGEGSDVPLLAVHPDGAAAAIESEVARRALGEGRPVLAVDTFQTGAAIAQREELPRYFSTFNRVDDAERIQDLLTAAAILSETTGEVPELYGEGAAATWTLFAAALEPDRLKLSSHTQDLDALHEAFLVPGIERAGGVAAAQRVLAMEAEAQSSPPP